MSYLQKLRLLLDRKTKSDFLWLMLFSVFLSAVETIGVSAIAPFIDIAINFDAIHSNQYYQWVFSFFGFEDDVNFAIVFGLVLIGFYVFRGGVRLLYSYLMANFAEGIYAQTAKKLFKAYLSMPYQDFTGKNSSYLTKAIITESSYIGYIIHSVLLAISEIFVVIFLYVLMLVVNWKITLIFTVIMAIKISFLTQIVSKNIGAIGVVRAKVQGKFYEIVNRLFGNFKQIKLQDEERVKATIGEFSKVADEYARVGAKRIFLEEFPNIFLETVSFSLVVLSLIWLLYSNQSSAQHILPTLSIFALALYRILPSSKRILNGYNSLMYYHKSIDIIDEELKTTQENLANDTINFEHKIELLGIDFFYKEKLVLENINLVIDKGEKIAFVGESGSGKSTLVDLIIGLYRPNQGEMRIDGVLVNEFNLQNWRSQVGYIPQQVYLFDGTIAENVCFGRKLDRSLLEKVLRQANIFNFLQTKQGTETLVGEGGIQLSGGQKQRVAIARALYGQPKILVLDEATSALDDKTEKKIMDEIYKITKDKTLIVIAHRLSTILGCDQIYKVQDGIITKQ